MKKISLLLLSLFMFGIFADELPANFSKYQAHYTFKCDHGEKCAAAFDKYMNTPEVKAMNLEVDLYALDHKGWNEATHQVSFYYKDADEYAMAGNYYNTSKAGLMFRNAMNKLGVESIMTSMTKHVAANVGDDAGSELVTVNWDINVSNPAEFLPLWMELSKSTENYDWNADACGVQQHMLGNNGNGITHNVWCVFSSPQAALSFLDNYITTPEFAEYSAKVSDHRTFLRSHMAYLVKEYNPD
mgnify:FL=1